MKFFVVFALAFAAACAAPSGEDSSMMMDASMMPMDMGDGEGKMMMSEGDMEKVMKVAMKMKMVKMMAAKQMMGDQCPMDMEMPTPDQMAAAVGEDLADKSMSAAGMCMNDDVKEVMSKAKEMMTMMKDGGMDQMMGDMMSGDMGGMDDAMCEEMKEGMCTMGKFQHCVLQKMDWTCPMGIPNYEVIREDLGEEGACLENMCCNMASMITKDCVMKLMEGNPAEMAGEFASEMMGMMKMEGGMPACECIYDGMAEDCPVLGAVRSIAYFDCLHDGIMMKVKMGAMSEEDKAAAMQQMMSQMPADMQDMIKEKMAGMMGGE